MELDSTGQFSLWGGALSQLYEHPHGKSALTACLEDLRVESLAAVLNPLLNTDFPERSEVCVFRGAPWCLVRRHWLVWGTCGCF